MRKILSNPWFLLVLRVVLSGVFVTAGLLKMGRPLEFSDSIATFQLLSPELINVVALVLPPF